jgi:hypothetical protein
MCSILMRTRRQGAVFWDGNRFESSIDFVRYFLEIMRVAPRCPENYNLITNLLESVWDSIKAHDGCVCDYKWTDSGSLTCLHTGGSKALMVSKRTFRDCYQSLRREQTTQTPRTTAHA